MFRVQESSWRKNSPYLGKPKAIGYFSRHPNRQLSLDASQMKYLCLPFNNEVYFDLNHGIEMVQRSLLSINNENIDHILKWIKQRMPPPPGQRKWLSAKIVCTRGILSKIMLTPHSKKDGWIICASKWRGTIYLCKFDTDDKKKRDLNLTEKDSIFTSWGYKFEQYLTSDNPNELPNICEPIYEAAHFNVVYDRQLANNRILYSAEMDAIVSKKIVSEPLPIEKLEFVEFKTCRIIENPRQDSTLRKFKFAKWWCQSFLVGVENVICGFRDDEGIVRELRNYLTSELPGISNESWSPQIMIDFCDKFLKYITEIVIKDYDQCVYKFERMPFDNIVVTEMSPSSKYSFLPEWFTKCEN